MLVQRSFQQNAVNQGKHGDGYLASLPTAPSGLVLFTFELSFSKPRILYYNNEVKL
jgi:hypothetical protein